MAKKSMIAREKKRACLAERYVDKRAKYKAVLLDQEAENEYQGIDPSSGNGAGRRSRTEASDYHADSEQQTSDCHRQQKGGEKVHFLWIEESDQDQDQGRRVERRHQRRPWDVMLTLEIEEATAGGRTSSRTTPLPSGGMTPWSLSQKRTPG